MATYRIIRVYEVPANSRYQATNRLMEAIILGTEKNFHQYDVIRPSDKPTAITKVDMRPPTGWFSLLKEQLLGNDR